MPPKTKKKSVKNCTKKKRIVNAENELDGLAARKKLFSGLAEKLVYGFFGGGLLLSFFAIATINPKLDGVIDRLSKLEAFNSEIKAIAFKASHGELTKNDLLPMMKLQSDGRPELIGDLENTENIQELVDRLNQAFGKLDRNEGEIEKSNDHGGPVSPNNRTNQTRGLPPKNSQNKIKAEPIENASLSAVTEAIERIQVALEQSGTVFEISPYYLSNISAISEVLSRPNTILDIQFQLRPFNHAIPDKSKAIFGLFAEHVSQPVSGSLEFTHACDSFADKLPLLLENYRLENHKDNPNQELAIYFALRVTYATTSEPGPYVKGIKRVEAVSERRIRGEFLRMPGVQIYSPTNSQFFLPKLQGNSIPAFEMRLNNLSSIGLVNASQRANFTQAIETLAAHKEWQDSVSDYFSLEETDEEMFEFIAVLGSKPTRPIAIGFRPSPNQGKPIAYQAGSKVLSDLQKFARGREIDLVSLKWRRNSREEPIVIFQSP